MPARSTWRPCTGETEILPPTGRPLSLTGLTDRAPLRPGRFASPRIISLDARSTAEREALSWEAFDEDHAHAHDRAEA